MTAMADNASSTRWQQDPCDSDHIDVIYKKIAAAAKPISSANDFRRHMYSTTDILKSKEGGVGRMMGKPTDALQELRSGMVSRAGRAEPRTERRKVSFAEDASSPARKLSEGQLVCQAMQKRFIIVQTCRLGVIALPCA
jgi:hypothetical protein